MKYSKTEDILANKNEILRLTNEIYDLSSLVEQLTTQLIELQLKIEASNKALTDTKNKIKKLVDERAVLEKSKDESLPKDFLDIFEILEQKNIPHVYRFPPTPPTIVYPPYISSKCGVCGLDMGTSYAYNCNNDYCPNKLKITCITK